MDASVEIPTDAASGSRGPAPATGGALPTTIVIGAQKCGTSTLHYYLALHPEISASTPKELDFFIAERNWDRGLDWYRAHFDPTATARLESSPNYSTYPHFEGIPGRMHEVIPDAKLIFMVRDPIARIEAHWVHNYAKRRERGSVIETITHPSTTYVQRSCYFSQLERFLEFYDPSRVLIFQQSDLRHRRGETLRKVFEFMGVDPDFVHPKFEVVRHRTEKKRRSTKAGLKVKQLSQTRGGKRVPKAVWNYAEAGLRLSRPIERPNLRQSMPPEVVRTLREDAERLREFTGRNFSSWSIWDTPDAHTGAAEPGLPG